MTSVRWRLERLERHRAAYITRSVALSIVADLDAALYRVAPSLPPDFLEAGLRDLPWLGDLLTLTTWDAFILARANVVRHELSGNPEALIALEAEFRALIADTKG
jgi:hypothetical protein